MSLSCPGCGHLAEEATRCPRCGFPVPASMPGPESPSIPGASEPSFATTTPGKVAEPAEGATPPSKRRPQGTRTALILGAAVVALTLVIGGAFAAIRASTGGGSVLPFVPVQLTVTGGPPSAAGSWSSGVQRLWRIDAEHYSEVEQDYASYSDASTVTSKSWAVTDFVGDTSHIYYGLDPESGKVMWGGAGYRDCAVQEVGGLVPCLDWVRGKDDESFDPVLKLVDWRTGEAKVTTTFAELNLSADLNPASAVTVADGEILLILPDYRNGGGDYLGDLAGVAVARVSANGTTTRWAHETRGCERSFDGDWRGTLQHGIFFAGYGLALDVETGKSVLDDSVCASVSADGVARVDPQTGSSAPASVTAPDASTVFTTSERSGFRPVGDRMVPVPLKLIDVKLVDDRDGSQYGTAGLVGFDPATGQVTWTTPLPVAVTDRGDGTPYAGSVLFDGSRLILRTDLTMQAVDPTTGTVLWSRPDPGGYGQTSLAADGTILADSDVGTDAYDPETGARLWQLGGAVVLAPGADGFDSLILFGSAASGGSNYIARLIPADRPTTAPVVPAAAPACPSGMAPISWTRFSDGGILLCTGDGKYAVMVPAHTDWQAIALTFTPGGHEVVFSNGMRIRVALGGSLVYVEANGAVTASPAIESWTNAVGDVKVAVPPDLKTCPAGSWPISLSTFDGGWLLICGTGPQQPTSMFLTDGSVVSDAASVEFRDGAYCGTTAAGKVCGYRAPAVVTVTPTGGTPIQHSATANYFSGHGPGGTGEGTGSYGVNTPKDNAKDQIRYLTQILQKSMAGRASLNTAVGQVRACTSLSEANATMNGVVLNRQELLDALESTPVDAVPDGAELVARLRVALALSHTSDLVWVQWAQAEQASSCAEGEKSSHYRQVTRMNRDVSVAKDSFLAMWNSQIVPVFGAPRFTRSQI